ncbi:YidC/Oxa1 family membrane protein insertase [Isoptericola sp. 4D.3]|uniref:Membrane protein insertase YidC n=1 Tax=Isoptericola peretonis TaxID=2918523 RepID=A0ABT0J3Q3_9MICO|nr:YidC/Oxa1 family membrane protein insertase [Isoptericola sp. 4D.3]
MDPFALPPLAAVLGTAYRALMGLSHLLEPALGVAAAAAAVVVVTLAVRAALIPVGVSQARAERTRARLAPRLAELQRRHRKDPEALQRATMRLYADEGTTPLAGCLPMLVQAPVVGVIYALFVHAQIAGHANALLGHALFGVPLGSSLVGALAGGGAGLPTFAVLGALVLAIALVGELTRRASLPGGPLAAPAAPSVLTAPGASAQAGPLAGPGVQRALGALQFVTAVVACFVPLAAGLYLLVTVAWTLAQRVVLRRRYPLDVPA